MTSKFGQSLAFAALATALTGPPVTGFTLVRIRPGSIYDKMGLKAGDTITAVNGRPIHGAEDEKNFTRLATTKGHLVIDLKRADGPKKIVYDVK
ncbi:MAG TPA: PDZ domain-containing protein [Bdellovibrionota bacterium]|jgi:serine protease DegQ|nr:PDZ domain-containing protein [Bdellovibrionota bacterium]